MKEVSTHHSYREYLRYTCKYARYVESISEAYSESLFSPSPPPVPLVKVLELTAEETPSFTATAFTVVVSVRAIASVYAVLDEVGVEPSTV